jgi:tRNA A37 threonylcarbamoyladenosine modification protein TsaB
LGRLAVATGPGGFTGTRLTVTLARTLAQQLGLPLDGIGSFLLIARRLQRLGALPAAGALWLVQELPRRGLVAGLYAAPKPGQPIRELLAPRLYPDGAALVAAEATLASPDVRPSAASLPRCPAQVHQPEDVAELLRFSQEAAAAGWPAPWPSVVPLYPTSPVELGL